jgi:hypothetical protein
MAKSFYKIPKKNKVNFESNKLISIYQDMEAYNITLDDFNSKSSLGKTLPSLRILDKKPPVAIPSISEELLSINKGY